MEACGSAHHWARKLEEFGHTVKLMAPQFVKPYVKTNKNDMADAEAICEAVSRPNMRFVPIKNVEQQAILSVHRARQGFVKARTAQANQIRGLLSEFGIVIPQGIRSIAKRVPEILEDGENGLPGTMRNLIDRLTDNLKEMDRQVEELEAQIKLWHRENEASRKLARNSGHRADHGERDCGDGGRCTRIQEWPSVGGMDGAGAQTTFQRRQADAAGHQQARRHLPAHLDDPRCTSGDPLCREQSGAGKLAEKTDGQAQQERGGGRAGEQECPDRVGTAGPGSKHSARITRRQQTAAA